MTNSLLYHGRKFGADLIDAAQQAYMGGLIEQDDHWDVVDENGDVVPVFAGTDIAQKFPRYLPEAA